MKKSFKLSLISLLALNIMVGCTGSDNSSSGGGSPVVSEPTVPEVEIGIDKLVTLSTGVTVDGSFADPIELQYSPSTTELEKQVVIRNPTATAKTLSLQVLNNSKMIISINRCPSSLAPNERCIIKLVHRVRQVPNGIYTGFLQIMAGAVGVGINSTISNSSYIAPSSDGSVTSDLSVLENRFDDYVVGQLRTKIVKLTNNSESKNITGLSYSLASGFKILLNRCGDSLAAKESCEITLYYGSQSSPPRVDDSLLILGSSLVKEVILVTRPIVSGLTLSPDRKLFTINGSNFSFVQSVKLVDGASVLDTLIIDSKTGSQIQAKPSQTLSVLGNHQYTLRLE